jgi:hypothetical protein
MSSHVLLSLGGVLISLEELVAFMVRVIKSCGELRSPSMSHALILCLVDLLRACDCEPEKVNGSLKVQMLRAM